MYMYIHTFVCMYIYTHNLRATRTAHLCMNTYVRKDVYTHVCVNTCTYIFSEPQAAAHLCLHTYVHKCVYTFVCVYIYIHIFQATSKALGMGRVCVRERECVCVCVCVCVYMRVTAPFNRGNGFSIKSPGDL